MSAIDKFLIYFAIAVLSVALLDSVCRADPFLAYDTTPPIEAYELEIDGVVIPVEPTVTEAGAYLLVYDLVNLSVGSHRMKARARYEKWGWVDWSAEFNMIRPDIMTGAKITTNP